MPAAKIKIGRRFVEGSEVAEYVLAKGSSAITGQGIMSKLGPCTLVGVVYSELGGTVPVYITTAWRGPLDNDGSPVAGSSARLMKAFEHMVSFVRFNVNRRGRCSLGAAAVPILNQFSWVPSTNNKMGKLTLHSITLHCTSFQNAGRTLVS